MKWTCTAVLIASLCASAYCAEGDLVLKTDKDKVSYSIGADIGKSFRTRGLDLNEQILIQGFKDAYAGKKTLLTDEEAQAALEAYKKEMMAKQEATAKEQAAKNVKEGATFLAENKKKEGVKTTATGVQYKILTAGTGKMPKATDTVKVHYRGTLIDGTEFDSSLKTKEPVTFPVNGVIPGWTEVLQLMPTGSKWQVVIPSNLAYGEAGAGQVIGPNATLIFDVELLSIEPPEKLEAPAPDDKK